LAVVVKYLKVLLYQWFMMSGSPEGALGIAGNGFLFLIRPALQLAIDTLPYPPYTLADDEK